MRAHSYPSDAADEQWALIEPHLPPVRPGGRARTTDLRDVVEGIFYVLRTGCEWRYLPGDFPPRSTVWRYFDGWRRDGTLDAIHDLLARRSAPRRGPITRASPPASIVSRSTRPPAASGGAATTPRMSTAGSGTSSST